MTRTRTRVALSAAAFAAALLAGEAVARWAGGYRLLALQLERPAPTGAADAAPLLRAIPDLTEPLLRATTAGRTDLDPAWLAASPPLPPAPPPLDQPLRPQLDWLLHYYVLNDVLLRAMWVKGQGLPMLAGLTLPERFATFAPPSGGPEPRYRYPASRTLPTGLRTNAFGFRGRELAAAKPPRTVRIGFVGASTTVEAHRIPFSAPELIEHWLALWAQAQRLDVRFETLNAAREAIQSGDIRAIVQDELLPLGVDFVVYYEGANQFQPIALQRHVRIDGRYELAQPPAGVVGAFDDAAAPATLGEATARHSALAERLRTLLRRGARQSEPAKPAQTVTLPDGFAGEFPLARAGEVLECGAIARDLDAIAAAAGARGARLCLATFAWLAEDGMTTDPVLGRNIFIHLNRAYWPFRYETIRTLADLQNRFFAAWAAAHGADLLDVAGRLPRDERLYVDAIHHNDVGVRLKAWLLFAQLTQLLQRDLSSGALPRPAAGAPFDYGAVREVTRAQLDAGR